MYIVNKGAHHIGECSACGTDWDSDLINEYDFSYCPYCGDKREHKNVVDTTNWRTNDKYVSNAKRTLVHYFRLALEKNGVPLNYDSVIEIEGIVDDIIEAYCAETIKKLL